MKIKKSFNVKIKDLLFYICLIKFLIESYWSEPLYQATLLYSYLLFTDLMGIEKNLVKLRDKTP